MPLLYYADLHTHSHHSRATSPACTPEGLYRWAQLKGLSVVGTGDCTHPAWLSELRDKLVEDSPGLYAPRPEIRAQAGEPVPESCRAPVRFMLTGEINSIYKRDGRVRKVHSVVLLPSFDAAVRLSVRLSQIGNVISDGRPTLGLDPRDLLEILLETDPRSALIPAHIWTPWFAMLGSKSGFDSVEACFGEWAPHIFAVETGLSSDAPMNRRIRFLDGVALVANSDAHSPANLGRNANRFFGEPSYGAMLDGLRARDPAVCGGTVHLFPEEGKYHLDGHRSCGVRLEPHESIALGNRCPVCGQPLTVGVLHRIVELEQRSEAGGRRSDGDQRSEGSDQSSPIPKLQDSRTFEFPPRLPYHHIIPLPELIGQHLGAAPSSKKVEAAYARVLAEAGPELPLLLDADGAALEKAGAIGGLIQRVRDGRVVRLGGYDGEYGTVRVAD